jgi:hypothetical protein
VRWGAEDETDAGQNSKSRFALVHAGWQGFIKVHVAVKPKPATCPHAATSAAPRIAFTTAKARFLTLAKKRFITHHRLARMIQRHLRDIVVVVRNAHHQARALAEETGGMLQFAEHGDALIGIGKLYGTALMYLQCVGVGAICMFMMARSMDRSLRQLLHGFAVPATFWRMTGGRIDLARLGNSLLTSLRFFPFD